MDKDRWDEIAETLGVRLFKYFKRRGLGHLASDMTQETLIRLYEKVESGQFDHRLGDFNQYAFGIARYVTYEHLFELEPHADIESQNLIATPETPEKLEAEQKLDLLRQAISQLKPVQQEILSLVMDEELSLEQISKILNMPVGTVKSHISRAKDQLRENLKSVWEHL